MCLSPLFYLFICQSWNNGKRQAKKKKKDITSNGVDFRNGAYWQAWGFFSLIWYHWARDYISFRYHAYVYGWDWVLIRDPPPPKKGLRNRRTGAACDMPTWDLFISTQVLSRCLVGVYSESWKRISEPPLGFIHSFIHSLTYSLDQVNECTYLLSRVPPRGLSPFPLPPFLFLFFNFLFYLPFRKAKHLNVTGSI